MLSKAVAETNGKGRKQVETLAPANVRLEEQGGFLGGLSRRVRNATAAYALTGSGLAAIGNFIFPSGIDYNGWGGFGGALGSFLSIAPRDFDYTQVNPLNSSIVMACLGWIARTFREAKPEVYKPDSSGALSIVPNHRATRLLRKPNPYYSYSKLMAGVLIDYNINGNGYIFIEQGEDGAGLPNALYFVPSWQMSPQRIRGSNRLIDYYLYVVDGKRYLVPPERVIHFRYEMDINNPMVGRRPLAPVFSEIFGDEQAAKYTAALLRNMAIPGVAITPEDNEVDIDEEAAAAMKEDFKRKFGGDNVGEPWIGNFRAKITVLGFNPEQMHLKDLRRVPEERVSACLGIAAIVAGLGAGLDRATYANFREAVALSVEGNLVPTWEDFGDVLTHALLPKFEKDPDAVIAYNTQNVKALQENADSKFRRYNSVWVTDVITRAEIRGALGLPVEEARDNIFYSDVKRAIAAATRPQFAPGEQGDAEKRFRLKATPRKTLDNAFAYMLEAEVAGEIKRLEEDFVAFLEDLGEEVEKRAEDGVDLDKPGEEAKRIGDEAFNAAIEGLIVIFANAGDNLRQGAIRAVSLTLGITEADAWNAAAQKRFSRGVETRRVDYSKALREQTITAIEEAIKFAKAGVPAAEVAERIRGFVEGRQAYPGIYQEAFDGAKARGYDDAKAHREGEESARNYRAKVIAETEARTIQNLAALDSLQTAGIDRVKVTDGDGCGWKSHEDEDKADNTVREIGEARKYSLAHPNCKRRFYPVEPEGEGN